MAANDWQRARKPEQKEERREAILAAAGRLLDAEGLEGTGLNAIAREAGISKANVPAVMTLNGFEGTVTVSDAEPAAL